jgi:HEPN domain-containing protein
MVQVMYQTREMAAARDAEQLRSRGERMLELATRAYCEQHYDFARLLTQLATEVFAHAKEAEESDALHRYPIGGRSPGERR